MKIGDKLYCKKSCVMVDGSVTTTAGKIYVIVKFSRNGNLMIIDDLGDEHEFTSFEFLVNLHEIRKKKLKKLNKIEV